MTLRGVRAFVRDRCVPAIDRLGIDQSRLRLPWGASLRHDLIRSGLIRPGAVIFDVGANVGQTALQYRRWFKPARILSFEPCADTYSVLVRQTRRYPIIECFRTAVGDRNGHAELKRFEESVLNQLIEADENDTLRQHIDTEQVPIITLDRLAEQQGIERIDFLKIDTEGHDLAVLRGAGGLLSRGAIKTIYCELGFGTLTRYAEFVEVRSLLEAHGYRLAGVYGQMPSYWLNRGGRVLDFCNALFTRELPAE